tara:strand:+ start:676 stop:1074 length:399 start_codon:yes stop_codon:yes gene_type:complete
MMVLGNNSTNFLEEPTLTIMSFCAVAPVSKHSTYTDSAALSLLVLVGEQDTTPDTFILSDTTLTGTEAEAVSPLDESPVLSELPTPGRVISESVLVAPPNAGAILSNPDPEGGVIIEGRGEGLFCPRIENEP